MGLRDFTVVYNDTADLLRIMSALVWAVESAILGVWALIFSFHSTPFHAFIARSHSIIAGFTLLLQLISTARDLPVGHAIAEAFVCAVTALLLIYVAALLDTANHTRFFSMSAAGLFPLDAAIGVAWFCAATVSATGMALSGVGKPTEDGPKHKASLMFHQYGYHMSIALPSLLMLWLYNYDATSENEPVYKGIKFVRQNDVTIGHTLIFIVYAGIWGLFVVAQGMGEGLLTMGKQWPAWKDMTPGMYVRYAVSALLKFIGRGGFVLVPLSAVFVAKTNAQVLMAWILVGVAGVYAIDLLGMFDKLVGKKKTPDPIDSNGQDDDDTAPSAPPEGMLAMAPELHIEAMLQPITQRQSSQDPAAVVLPMGTRGGLQSMTPYAPFRPPLHPAQLRRDKMV